MLFLLWPLILSTHDFYAPFLTNDNFVLMSCKIFGFFNFYVSHLNYEKLNLCLPNTLNMLKTTRVYFEVLQLRVRKEENYKKVVLKKVQNRKTEKMKKKKVIRSEFYLVAY